MAKNNEEKISIKQQFVALDKSMKGVKKVGPGVLLGLTVLGIASSQNNDSGDGGSNA